MSPDGARMAYLALFQGGEDVVVAPFDRAQWVERTAPSRPVESHATDPAVAPSLARSYSPLRPLLPRYWSPLLSVGEGAVEVGGETSASDVLGRHEWRAAFWKVSGTRGSNWSTQYMYARWRPTMFVAASADVDDFGDVRETARAFTAGAVMPFSRVRRAQQVFASVQIERVRAEATSGASATVDRNAWRAGWAWSNARGFGYSISPEEGFRVGLTAERVAPSIGATAAASAAVLDGRVYQRFGSAHSVLAVRAAAAVSNGDRRVRRRFGAGCGNQATGLTDLGGDAVALIRGIETNCAFATRAAVGNVDYRFPLWRVERGVGAYPGFVRWLHAGVFVDAGDEWDRSSRARWKVSSGVELSLDVVVGHYQPFTLASGVAWVRDPASGASTRPRTYVRVGRAF